MAQILSQNQTKLVIRPLQYRDLEIIEKLLLETSLSQYPSREVPFIEPLCESPRGWERKTPKKMFNLSPIDIGENFQQIRRWYWLLKFLSWFPNPCRYLLNSFVAEQDGKVKGVIQIDPVNRTRSSWRVERVATEKLGKTKAIGSQLLRYCFEIIWEARTWLLEVDVNDTDALALYRQNGFQPLAQMTYWAIAPEQLQELAVSPPDLPNLLPVSNADAHLLYQLDTVSMPPQVRQVFDRHIQDFKTSFLTALIEGIRQWWDRSEVVSGYVFEPQRKAAIGYFQVQLCRDGKQGHIAQLTVHPAYTWLYPELLSQMATLAQDFPPQSLQLVSADYQPEREAYLEQVGAERMEHTLLMSRSVWHKLRESKSMMSDLQLSEVLQGLQPARKPVPSRSSWLRFMDRELDGSDRHDRTNSKSDISELDSGNSHSLSESLSPESQDREGDRWDE